MELCQIVSGVQLSSFFHLGNRTLGGYLSAVRVTDFLPLDLNCTYVCCVLSCGIMQTVH